MHYAYTACSILFTSENIAQLFSLNCALLSEVHVPKSVTCTGRDRKLTSYQPYIPLTVLCTTHGKSNQWSI